MSQSECDDMIPAVQPCVWAFDLEWAPDPRAGRLLLQLPADLPDADVVQAMWKAGGATDENPMPFLKLAWCRVVSVAAVQRRVRNGHIELNLLWLPRHVDNPAENAESAVLGTFLDAIGRLRPQLVGFNSRGSDLRIMLQRAVTLGLRAPAFCERPNKPWEGPDYFARDNPAHVDLMESLGTWGAKGMVSLHDMTTLSGIPGKIDTGGEQVAAMWLRGAWREIVQYNCFDAISTYLLWLRMAHFTGHFTSETYEEEQESVRQLLMSLAETPDGAYLETYFDEWHRLESLRV